MRTQDKRIVSQKTTNYLAGFDIIGIMEDFKGGETSRKGGRRKKYIPGLACIKFSPDERWNPEEAQWLYEGSPHSLHYQDTIRFEDCIRGMKQMPPDSVDLVVADPPFGIDFSGKESNYNRNRDLVVDSYQEIDGDYGEFTEQWMASLQRVMKPQATAYVFSGWNHLEEVLRGARLSGLTTINHIIWKYQFGVFTKKKYVTSHYHVLLLAKDPDRYYFNKMEHYPLDVWDIKRKYKAGEVKNGTTLPLEVVKRCIVFSSRPGDLVFDPFMGMGTSAVAAKSTWRHFFGFEKNEHLKQVIEERVAQMNPGDEYDSLEDRIKEIRDEARKKYPLAYKVFLKESGGQSDVES